MQSLRRRPSDAPAKRLTYAASDSPNKLRTQPKDARKSRVGDKIKKRMSMRYADISEPVGIPDVPAIPTRALRPMRNDIIMEEEEILDYDDLAPAGGRRGLAKPIVTVDKEAMQQNGFDPSAYLKTKISNSSESELKQLSSALLSAKDEASTDLQRNVFQNYEEFVLISKEISTLENDMLELKEGLTEWKGMPALLNIDDSASASTDRRRQNRSSVADLARLYATQITTLHTTIEGSAKFVPPLAGRHVVLEIESLWSLNAATYKVEYAVHFVLLDDALLVAKRRKRRTGEGGKLVAERCWALSEISILDVKDSSDVTRAFRIRRGRENYVYRCDKSSDKKNFLSTFKATAEEFAARRRKEREGEHERRRSMWNADDSTRMSIIGDIPGVPELPGSRAPLGGSMQARAEQDARWVGEFTDDLSVAIALRNWGTAIDLVEQGKARLASIPSLAAKLTPLRASLVAALLHALSDPGLRKAGVTSITSHLIRLGEANAARDAFLAARTELVRKRARMIGFEGEIPHYISELAIVIFTSIKHTAEWYLASFKDNDMASGFIVWANVQLELFATLFKRQVDGQTDPQDVQDSLTAMRAQSKRLLRDNNLDFSFLLDSLLTGVGGLTLSDSSSSVAAAAIVSPPRSRTASPAPIPGRPPRVGLSPLNVPPTSSSLSLGPMTPTTPSRSTTPRPSIPAVPAIPSSPSRSAARIPRPPRSPGPMAVPPRSRDRPPSSLQ